MRGPLGLYLSDTPEEHDQPAHKIHSTGDSQHEGYVHDRDGQHVGKDDQEDDIVVIVPIVAMPVVNGARCPTWLQTIPPKDIQKRRNNKDKDQEPGTDNQDQAVAQESRLWSKAWR